MGKGGVGKIATLGVWGIRRKEAAAELGMRGMRKQQGKCVKEERSFEGRRERRKQQRRGTV